MTSAQRVLPGYRLTHLALEIRGVLPGQGGDTHRGHRATTGAMTTSAPTSELRSAGFEVTPRPRSRRSRATQPGDVSRYRCDRLVASEMVVIRKVLHAQIAARSGAEALKLTSQDLGGLAAYRGHGTVGHATTIFAVASRAISIELCARLDASGRREHGP